MRNVLPVRRAPRLSRIRVYVVGTTTSVLACATLVASCSEPERVFMGDDVAEAGPPPAFAQPTEAGSDDVVASPLVTYCPSSTCPAGHTTCPNSVFPCDVDINNDISNCGACGSSCPRGGTQEFFSCVNGQCVMTCEGLGTKTPFLDCDGLVDTGCELQANNNDNCGACGVKCTDPDKPCLSVKDMPPQCGCPAGMLYCAPYPQIPQFRQCVDIESNDANCGACGNQCDSEGDGGAPAHAYFGCNDSQCGNLKCSSPWDNCDSDPANGCETELATDTNCAGCGDDCLAKNQTCLRTPAGKPYCGCGEGATFCGSCASPGQITIGDGGLTITLPVVCKGYCYDLTSDTDNCGACGAKCEGTCEYGSCMKHCPYGRADCDGNPDCEVAVLNDPSNCGGCGIVCDAIAGQACVGGRCVVEPCGPVDGGGAR